MGLDILMEDVEFPLEALLVLQRDMRGGGAKAPTTYLLATCHELMLGFASRVRDLGIGGNKASLHPEISCLNRQPFVDTGKITL